MSLGPAEILVILVVALIVFGPQRLPEVGRQVGSAVRELRRMQDSVKSELNDVMHGFDDKETPIPRARPALSEPDHTQVAAPSPPPADPAAGEHDDGFGGPDGSFL